MIFVVPQDGSVRAAPAVSLGIRLQEASRAAHRRCTAHRGRSYMSGEATEPEPVTRLVVERLNAGDAAGVAALYEPRAVLAYPTDEPTTGREAIQAIYQRMVTGDQVRCRHPAANRQVRGSGTDLDPLGRQHRRQGPGPAPTAGRLLDAHHRPPRGSAGVTPQLAADHALLPSGSRYGHDPWLSEGPNTVCGTFRGSGGYPARAMGSRSRRFRCPRG
jgi:hypothetical protein